MGRSRSSRLLAAAQQPPLLTLLLLLVVPYSIGAAALSVRFAQAGAEVSGSIADSVSAVSDWSVGERGLSGCWHESSGLQTGTLHRECHLIMDCLLAVVNVSWPLSPARVANQNNTAYKILAASTNTVAQQPASPTAAGQ